MRWPRVRREIERGMFSLMAEVLALRTILLNAFYKLGHRCYPETQRGTCFCRVLPIPVRSHAASKAAGSRPSHERASPSLTLWFLRLRPLELPVLPQNFRPKWQLL